MQAIVNWIETDLGIPSPLQAQIFRTLFIIIIIAFIYSSIKKILYRTIDNSKTYYRAKKSIGYLFVAIGFILVGRVWFKGIQSLTTFLGLFSAGLAIAMKDFIMNIAGWMYIVWKGPFRVGDRIEIDGISGDVIDIQVLEFAIMETRNWVDADQSTGRIVHVPNIVIFNKALFNYSKGIPFIWNEIPIYITFESNWKKAKKILQDIAHVHGESISGKAEESIKEASRKFVIFNAKLEPTVYTSIDNENSIKLTIRYMCSYRNRRDSSEKIYEEILERFANHEDIKFAYPTQRVYDRPRETQRVYDDRV